MMGNPGSGCGLLLGVVVQYVAEKLHLRFYSLHFHHFVGYQVNSNQIVYLYPFFIWPGNGQFFKRVAETVFS